MNLKNFIISILGGVGITLITGFIPRKVLLGATHTGWPFAWLVHLVLAPEYYPWEVLFTGLAVDVILWGLVVFLLINYVKHR